MKSKCYYTKGSMARKHWLSEPILNLGADRVRKRVTFGLSVAATFRLDLHARSPPHGVQFVLSPFLCRWPVETRNGGRHCCPICQEKNTFKSESIN